MRTLTKTISADVGTFEELQPDDQELLLAAIEVVGNSQSPYSEYLVGAAVRAASGEMAVGVNVEDCIYDADHAEAIARGTLVTNVRSGVKIVAVAVVHGPGGTPIAIPDAVTAPGPITFAELPSPSCARCRQKLWENCHADGGMRLIGMLPNGEVYVTTMGSMYPLPFGPNDLGITYK